MYKRYEPMGNFMFMELLSGKNDLPTQNSNWRELHLLFVEVMQKLIRQATKSGSSITILTQSYKPTDKIEHIWIIIKYDLDKIFNKVKIYGLDVILVI